LNVLDCVHGVGQQEKTRTRVPQNWSSGCVEICDLGAVDVYAEDTDDFKASWKLEDDLETSPQAVNLSLP
jgi:hypothetical protein